MKFIYVGDPTELKDGTKAGPNQGRQVSYTEPGTGKVFTFPFGEAAEAPKWLADRLAKSNHFKAASEKPTKPSAPSPEAPKPAEDPKPAEAAA